MSLLDFLSAEEGGAAGAVGVDVGAEDECGIGGCGIG